MKHKDLFPIGTVAKLFHTSVGTLRHYEAMGLLAPEHIDPDTGYRYYSVRQFEPLNTIRYLRLLDLPLPQIAGFLQNRDADRIEGMLRQQKAVVLQKQEELRRIERRLDARIRQLRDARTAPLDQIRLHTVPACRVLCMEDPPEIRASADLELPIRRLESALSETVVFPGKVGIGISVEDLEAGRFQQYSSVFLILDEGEAHTAGAVVLPESLCVSIRFRGSHPAAPERYQRLMDHIRDHRLRPAAPSREVMLIDDGITSDSGEFVTEICIPVAER